MPLQPSQTVSQSSNVLATEVDGEIVLVGIETGQYYGLDGVGSAIWRAIEQPVQVEALCARLREDFDGAPERIDSETLDFLDTLITRQLIDVA